MTKRQKLKSTYTAIVALSAAILFIFTSLFGVGTRLWASADVAETSEFESRNVLDDLKNSVIGDKAFNMSDYPADENGSLRILTFVEYCYAYDAARMGYYGLYLYVYNPQQTIFDFAKGRNIVQMRVGGGSGEDFDKYPLEYMNCNTDSVETVGLFYKLKIVLTENQRAKILDKLNPESRVYEVSGIELMTYGNYTAQDYSVASMYTYSGYAAGYGENQNAESTLKCSVDLLKVANLDVHHTFYRTKTSQKGAGYQVQLDTVYFSVPKELMDEYGKLQRIKAEWWEYKTKDIFVTSNSEFYNALLPYVGKDNNKDSGWREGLESSFTQYATVKLLPKIYYLFDTNGIPISNYDPYADISASGGISSNRLYDYIKNYDLLLAENGMVTIGGTPNVSIKNGKIPACLFQEDIDDSRKADNEHGKIQQGYSYYDFDIDTDIQEIKTYKPNNYFTDFERNAKVLGFWRALFGYYSALEGWTKTLPPIQILTDEDIEGTSESDRQEISDTLCVNYNDVEKLQTFYSEAQANDEEVVLLRFATSDYYSKLFTIVRSDAGPLFHGSDFIKNQVYVANQSVFFDFDVIQLAFSKEGATTIMAAVSSPIDIVNPITPPYVPPVNDWWKYALGIIATLIVVWVVVSVVIKMKQKV